MSWAAPAGAAPAVAATPSTGLTDGATVSVSATGYAPGLGAITQCNDAAGQPTIAVAGNQVPVSCTDPLKKLVNFDAAGVLTPFPTAFTVRTGVTGPPAAGTDSAGRSAAESAKDYPCPPTAAQVAAGASCIIAVGDATGGQGIKKITFQSATATTTTAAPAVVTTTTAARASTSAVTTTTTTAVPTAVLGAQFTNDDPPLAATGPSRAVTVLALIGLAVLDVGYLLESSTHAPRRALRRVRRWVTEVFPCD